MRNEMGTLFRHATPHSAALKMVVGMLPCHHNPKPTCAKKIEEGHHVEKWRRCWSLVEGGNAIANGGRPSCGRRYVSFALHRLVNMILWRIRGRVEQVRTD
jgi:hypothetical protein